jgi:hypothetical protein
MADLEDDDAVLAIVDGGDDPVVAVADPTAVLVAGQLLEALFGPGARAGIL